ncbi:MAG: ferritin [Planctomycetota bacterium]|jgi:ferritin
MLSARIQQAFNEQLNAELYSAYLYLSMSAQFEDLGLKGFAGWMRCQAQEEVLHAMKFYGHITERGGRALMQPIEGPQTEWDSPTSMLEHTLEHEQKVTALIGKLVDLATEEGDHAANAFLQWFVAEQVEEEASADDVLRQLKLVDDSQGLLMLDREMGQRVFVVPAAQGEGAE